MIEEMEQLTLDPDIWCGKTSPEPSVPTKQKTSASSSKKPPKSATKMPLFLCLTKESGQPQGASWEMGGALLAEFLGVSQKVVWRFMKNHGIKARVAAKRNQRGENNSYWKGGKRISEQGYIEIYFPTHPKAKPNGYVREHMLVAEQMLGRPLKYFGINDERTEVVHHINGIKTDNRPENLLVLGVNEHHKLHNALNKSAIDEILLARIRSLEQELRNYPKKG